MQAVGRMQPGVVRAEFPDPRPASGVDSWNDHRVDPGLAGAIDHGAAIGGERVVIEVDMAVDKLGPNSFSCTGREFCEFDVKIM
jgi:hypothetical protein